MFSPFDLQLCETEHPRCTLLPLFLSLLPKVLSIELSYGDGWKMTTQQILMEGQRSKGLLQETGMQQWQQEKATDGRIAILLPKLLNRCLIDPLESSYSSFYIGNYYYRLPPLKTSRGAILESLEHYDQFVVLVHILEILELE